MNHHATQIESPLFSRESAADYLQISTRTLDLMIARGVMRPTRIGSRVFVHRDEVDRIVRDGAKLTVA